MNRVDPNLWKIPAWDPAWDAEFEFESLRTFARAVMDGTDLGAALSVIEEGYARLEVFQDATRVGLVYVNRSEDRSVPRFIISAGAGDEELATTDIAAAVRFLDARRTPSPPEAA